MKSSEIRKKLEELEKEHGDLDMFFQDPNSHGGPFLVGRLTHHVAELDEYPDDWNMPEGYEFIQIDN